MSTAKFHALAASAILRKEAPKGARAWSRALPSLEVRRRRRRRLVVVVAAATTDPGVKQNMPRRARGPWLVTNLLRCALPVSTSSSHFLVKLPIQLTKSKMTARFCFMGYSLGSPGSRKQESSQAISSDSLCRVAAVAQHSPRPMTVASMTIPPAPPTKTIPIPMLPL